MSMRYTGKNWKEVRRVRKNKPWPQMSTYESIVAAKKRVANRQEKAFVYDSAIKFHRGE